MNTNSLKDQVAIVTGAGSGIGFQVAFQLTQVGAQVILNDVDEDLCKHAEDKIHKAGGHCSSVVGDAGDLEIIESLINTAIDHYGKISICVCNAGITTFGRFLDYTPKEFDQLIELNLKGSFFLAQSAARRMKEYGSGSILLMSSVTGIQTHPNLAAYGMTKAALQMLAKSLAIELAPYSIKVNALAPGATLTERTSADPGYEETWSNLSPSGRPSLPMDVAETALFLLSGSSAQITGQTIVIDGGWTLVSPPPQEEN